MPLRRLRIDLSVGLRWVRWVQRTLVEVLQRYGVDVTRSRAIAAARNASAGAGPWERRAALGFVLVAVCLGWMVTRPGVTIADQPLIQANASAKANPSKSTSPPKTASNPRPKLVAVITAYVVTADRLRVRKVPSVSGNQPVKRLEHGTPVNIKKTIKTKSDPYRDGRNNWAQLTDGKWVWSGGIARQIKLAANVTKTDTAAWYAQQILASHNVTLGLRDKAGHLNLKGKQDLQRTAKGLTIRPCGREVRVSKSLLKAIWKTSLKYRFRINTVASDHRCNQFQHPKGKGMDLGMVSGVRATSSSLGGATYRGFARYLGSQLPVGADFMQAQCMGHVSLPKGVLQHSGDVCNHLHVNV